MFDKRTPFYESMQKIEARKWYSHKETFDQYVLAKLALMHGLTLPVRDMIHLLIGGIVSAPIRATALSLASETIKDFLDKMQTIAEGCAETNRKIVDTNKVKVKPCRNCGGSGHLHKDCRNESKCFYCKKPGHRQYDCLVMKRERSEPADPIANVVPRTSRPSKRSLSSRNDMGKLELDDSVQMDSIDDRKCNLVALVDTGSSVSFIKYCVYLSYWKYFAHKLRPTKRKFMNIKDSLLEVLSSIEVNLTLRLLNDKKLTVTLFVIIIICNHL